MRGRTAGFFLDSSAPIGGRAMSMSVIKGRVWLLSLCLPVLVASCGGAESRKAVHLEKGEAYLAAGNFEKARVEFRNALQIAPVDSEVRFENGVVDEKLDNTREAASFYQGAIDSNPENIRARVALGRIYMHGGAPKLALDAINPAFAKHPDDAGLLTVRAGAHAEQKDTAAALVDAERAVQLAPANEDALSVLASIYQLGGQTDKATALLEDGIKRVPDSVNMRLQLAQLYADRKQLAQAEALLADLVRLEPKEKAHRLRLAQFEASLDKIDDAERTLREGIKALPEERDLKIGLINLLATRRSREVAERELQTFIEQAPKDYQLQFALAQFYEEGKDDPKAEAIYNKVITAAGLDPPGITARDRLAALRNRQHDPAGAEKLLAEVLAKAPRDDDALFLRGNIALARKDPKTAIADLRSVLRDQPNAIGVMRVLARAHLANGEPALAEETMRRAVEANPADAAASLDLAQMLIELGKPEQAKPVVDELVRRQPTNVEALIAKFRIAVASKDAASAKAAADAVVATRPTFALGYYYQGGVAEMEQRFDDAIRLYSSALDLQPAAHEPLQALARVFVARKRAPEALKRVDQAAAQFPNDAFPLTLKGELLISQGHNAEGLAAFKSAIDREPKDEAGYRTLAYAQVGAHDNNAAIATLQSGIGQVATPEPLEKVLAELYERAGKPNEAIQVYEDALRRDPQSDLLANNLASLLVDTKKDPASLERAKQLSARLSTSTRAEFLDTYGWVLYKEGDMAAALDALQKASAKDPELPALWYHLGMTQLLAGQSDAARDSLTHSLKSGQSFSGIDEAKAALDKLTKQGANNAAPKS
jgi:tetratricopeptide (TPR) repeat protein